MPFQVSVEIFDEKITRLLADNEERLQVICSYKKSVSGYFSELIRRSKETYGLRTVVLIDEYDKPILDNITDPQIGRDMRDGLKNLYSVIKAQDANIQFVLLTGVSKFSKVSLFSGLNNLTDITLDSEYATICGYTEPEMTEVFAEHLRGKPLEDIRRWYNGYSWLGEKVYNPFSILNYLRSGVFRNYWFETGTPAFLVDLFNGILSASTGNRPEEKAPSFHRPGGLYACLVSAIQSSLPFSKIRNISVVT